MNYKQVQEFFTLRKTDSGVEETEESEDEDFENLEEE